MNCNRCTIVAMPPMNRCQSCIVEPQRHFGPPLSLPTRMQKQRRFLWLFLVSFAVLCCISGWVGGNAPCAHVVHALVAPNAAVGHGDRILHGGERIAKSRSPGALVFPPVTLQRQNRFLNRESGMGLNQQSNDSAEIIDRDNADSPMATPSTILAASVVGTESNVKSSRRWFLTTAGITTGFVVTALGLPPSIASASSVVVVEDEESGMPAARTFEYTENGQTAITIPLAFTGQELLVAYKVDGSKFKAVLDTGSPFLMIPGSCGSNTRQKSGCYQNQGGPVPKLTPTIEIFDGFQGEVNWRSAPFEFWDVNNNDSINGTSSNAADASIQTQQEQMVSTDKANGENNFINKKRVIFGVASEAIMGGPGGVFFGMIRDTDARIRPSFLGQTDVRAFRVNLAARPRTLTLSNEDLIHSDTSGIGENNETVDYIPMTNLLRRKYGDPVGHYTALAQSIYVNGYPLVDTTIEKNSKILVIFDTGVTGMVVSRGLFDEQYMLARKRREKTLFGDVELTFSTALGKANTLSATKPLATPFDPEQTWKKFPKRREGKKSTVHIIVMGLAFLEGRSLTVDIDKERLWVE